MQLQNTSSVKEISLYSRDSSNNKDEIGRSEAIAQFCSLKMIRSNAFLIREIKTDADADWLAELWLWRGVVALPLMM